MSEALKKIEQYFTVEERPFADPETEATFFLVWLYAEGFKIVPVEDRNELRHG